MDQKLKLLLIGAGNIAKSVIRGLTSRNKESTIVKGLEILVVAPTSTNLEKLHHPIVRTCLITNLDLILAFKPDVVFICVKPQIFQQNKNTISPLGKLLKATPKDCLVVSVMAGIATASIWASLEEHDSPKNIIRAMFNVAAEIQQSNAFLYMSPDIGGKGSQEIQSLFKRFAPTTNILRDESLMDVCTGLTGSGIAFFYEFIQAISDIGVLNGLGRQESLKAAAQLSIAAGKMCLETQSHPYQLRDDVASPAGCTIKGLGVWHENSINVKIGKAFQASIGQAKELSK